jgi:hypothetical protein
MSRPRTQAIDSCSSACVKENVERVAKPLPRPTTNADAPSPRPGVTGWSIGIAAQERMRLREQHRLGKPGRDAALANTGYTEVWPIE